MKVSFAFVFPHLIYLLKFKWFRMAMAAMMADEMIVLSQFCSLYGSAAAAVAPHRYIHMT